MKKIFLSIAAFTARILPNSFKQAIYKIKPLARLIRSGLNRVAPTGLVEVKIAAGDLAGFNLLLDMQVDKDYWLGTYEMDLQSALHKLIPAGVIIYDLGANIGYVSLLLAQATGEKGKVFAFEALPSNVEQLKRSAVTQAAGPVHFLVHLSGGMGKVAGSAGRKDQYQSELVVPGISLDDFVYGQGNPLPQVIKMDIEGGEVLVLPGMRRILTEAHPLMLIELHGPESSRIAWEVLTGADYEFFWMRPGFPAIPSLDKLGWKAYIVARQKSSLNVMDQ
jgi:FkbM family methyltransferase